MPIYPLLYEAKEKNENIEIELTESEERYRRQDFDEIKAAKQYRKKYETEWLDGAKTFNLVQEGSTDDRISNIYIGIARMIIDQGIAMMTEGQPEFDFDPIGPSDHKKVILWKAAIKSILDQCNYKSHQDKFITDFHVFGTGVFEVYTERPFRLLRYETTPGSFTEKVARDFRKTKVGVRHVSPFSVWRNPNVSDPDDVPSGGKEEILTYNQFVQNYANVYYEDENGTVQPKYKNIKKALSHTASHFKVTRQENEIGDAVRVYALPFGTNIEGEAMNIPEFELGYPIFDKPLKIKRVKKGDGSYRSSGLNVLGQTTLCFGANNGQYDKSFKTHALYGLGIPKMIEGPDTAIQAFLNMTFDNMRLANTLALSYKPYDGKTHLDLDSRTFYSGDFIDGDLVSTPFGQARLSENKAMYEWLNELCIFLTGVNFQQIAGDTSKTAFEFAQRIRSNNMRSEKRLRTLENGCLKRMATLLLANVLSEMTVEEWEDMTEEEAEAIAERISKNEAAGEDYKLADSPPKKRIHFYIPVEGRKFREDFSTTKKRKLDYSATDNTLIEDPNMEGNVSYVPMDERYFFPENDIESIMRFNARVSGKRMLGDLKAQDMEMMQKGIGIIQSVAMIFPEVLPKIDPMKLISNAVRPSGMEEKDYVKQEGEPSKLQQMAKQAQSSIDSPPINAAALPPALPQVNPQGLGANPSPTVSPPASLQNTATGAL